MGKKRQQDDDEEPGIIGTVAQSFLTNLRMCLGKFLTSKPPEPAPEVVDLLQDMRVTPRLVMQYWKTFGLIKQYDSITARTGPDEVSVASVTKLVRNEREWVSKIMVLLLDLAGFRDTVTWDGFLFVTMQFCAMSKLELCQLMFYIVSKEMRSWTVHYLTSSQLEEFYDDYYTCPVPSFNTSSVDFAKLPLAKYRMQDFIELCYRFSQLVNPCMHLQTSLQQRLPSLRFWSDYDRMRVYNRRITIDFFRFRKVASLLEIMQRQNGQGVGPLQKYRMECVEKFKVLEKHSPGYGDAEQFHRAILKAGELCRPTQKGVIPLPLGVLPPTKQKLARDMALPNWMYKHLEGNEAPGPLGGRALGYAAEVEAKRRDAVPKWFQSLMDKEPTSVEEAEELVRSTMGEMALKSKVKQIAADLTKKAKPRSEEIQQKAVVRNQELEFIRKSRTDMEPPNLVNVMFRIFQEELIDRNGAKPVDMM